MRYKILPFIILISVITVSCNKKQEEKKPKVKSEVVVPKEEVKDTLPPEPTPIPEPVVEKPKNKYFLIAGSFSSMDNAEKFQSELIQQGYDSEVIIRKTGKNQDFYKVSYKGFADKDEAFNQLSVERKLPNQEDVWLLIKR